MEKQRAVAGIDERQRALAITVEPAAVLYAKEQSADVDHLAADIREKLAEAGGRAAGGCESGLRGVSPLLFVPTFG